MSVYSWLIFALWLMLFAYWAFSATRAKKSIREASVRWRETGLRLGALVLIVVALRVPSVRHVLRHAHGYAASTGMVTGIIGVVLCVLGVCLALWARVHLGTNWGMPMSRKESPELVTTGPYALVRHPIYSGLILAMIGSAGAQSILWVVPLALFGVYFTYSARREERLMTEQIPDQYPAYKRRTKMFVPCAW
ncbi:MAG: methyltransferase family protein [Steroidobacteraceae bacterium]